VSLDPAIDAFYSAYAEATRLEQSIFYDGRHRNDSGKLEYFTPAYFHPATLLASFDQLWSEPFSASQPPPIARRPEPPLQPPPIVRVHSIAPRLLPARRRAGGGGIQAPVGQPSRAQPAPGISDEPLTPDGIELRDGQGEPGDELPGAAMLPAREPLPEPPRLVRALVDVRPPRKLAGAAPVYPPLAIAARVEGSVVLECTIGVDGRIGAVQLLRGHPLLSPAAALAVSGWSYTPTLLNGVPVSVLMTVTVEFRLNR
jgi:protein TonB